MAEVIVNPTPRQVFRSSPKKVQKHREMVQSDSFLESVDVALLQYQRILAEARVVDGSTAAAHHFRICGANEFVSILKGLAEPAGQPKKQTHAGTLNHQA